MISTREELLQCLKEEKDWYFRNKSIVKASIFRQNRVVIYRFIRALRFAEYHSNHEGRFHKIPYVYWERRKNALGRKLGIEIWENSFEPGLHIFHCGNIVVNSDAKIGRDCSLHGSNCIGNTGRSLGCPVIGDRVQLGFGAVIIGNVKVADDITVAAGAIVVDSFLQQGVTIGGIPARVIAE